MSDTKFTPGPWRVIDTHPTRACLHIGSPNDNYDTGDVATIYCAGRCDWFHDAHLISAAPALFAKVDELHSYLIEEDKDYEGSHAALETEALLAMARGEPA